MRPTRPLRSVAAIGALALMSVAAAVPAVAKNDSAPSDTSSSVAKRPVGPPGQAVTFDIASITDFHGQLVPVKNSSGVVTNGGVLGVSGVLETLRAQNRNTIFVANGDSIGGSAFESAVLEDVPTIELLNAMDLVVSNTGNHEFDKGWLDLRDRVLPLADFDYLGANISGTPELPPYMIHRLTGGAGVTVAFIGTLTPELPSLVSPGGIEGITVGDPCTATNMYADRLSDGRVNNGEADIVIALSHYGHADLAQCTFSANVDAALSGHTHDPIVTSVMRADGVDIPLVEGQNAGGTVAHLRLTYDRKADTLAYDVVENIETEGVDAAGIPFVEKYTPEVKAIYDAALAAAAEAGKAVVGSISNDLLRPVGGTRGHESSIGDFLAGVALWQGDQITGADFGIINPGGIRADLVYAGDTSTNPLNVDGAVTYAEAFTVQPFGNTMGTVDLTGAQVDTLLEQQWQDGASRPMLRLGLSANVSYVFDPTRPQYDRVMEIFIDGVPIDPAATYTVAANSFLLEGGDDFTVLTEGANSVDTGIIDLQSLLDYFKAMGSADPDYVQHSVGLALSAPLVPGTTVTAAISSLALTNVAEEPMPATVQLLIDGALVGEAAVDNEVDTETAIDADVRSLVDMTGQATITFVVPAGVTADSPITIVTNDGYTNITF
ncbi:MAG: bifunctional metallophosphatase/5'-nucleotidase [Actinomycetales bacterium]|nr:bifunctional metallophosphatase/5'-nucleotidase [Actinomycetales bacterium]